MAEKRPKSSRPWLLKLALEEYETERDYPFAGDDHTAVLRHADRGKWYGLIMTIPYRRLGLNQEGLVHVLNVKADPILAGSFRCESGIYPAYHMNKQSWLSILLDGTVPKKTIRTLLDISYSLTAPKKGSGKKGAFRISKWIVPANPKFISMEEILEEDENGTFCFKQSSNVCVGDTVYIYVAAPVSAIRYQCEAVEVNIPDDYQDENLRVTRLMRLRLLKTLDRKPIDLPLLREHGVLSVRGPRSIPLSLLEEINRAYPDE
ncbi:MAG: MmcQ/YjbR family DNA-binding protein [Oscillospiraceae bacterium]|nr:MmcQ/YjbR family DNA-binding protein [Oscillospiraceae bacterium]